MNVTILEGHLLRDPELKFLPSGQAVCNIGIATNETWKTEDGEKKERKMFIDGAIWGKPAENAAEYLHKGSHVLCRCILQMEEWVDKDTDKKRTKHTVKILECKYLDKKGDAPEGD